MNIYNINSNSYIAIEPHPSRLLICSCTYEWNVLTLSMVRKNSNGRQFEIFVLYFPIEYALTSKAVPVLQCFVRRWNHMWSLFCHYLFHISSFGASGMLNFGVVALPGYLHLYFWTVFKRQIDQYFICSKRATFH